jgi:hypothetical protein
MLLHVPKLAACNRVARKLAVVAVALVGIGVAEAQQRPRSQADSGDPDARGTTRQTVRPGQPPSSRREPSRVNDDEATPTVQNRAPEVIAPRPEAQPAPAAGTR